MRPRVARCGRAIGTTGRPAWDSRGTCAVTARRASAAATASSYERNFGNVTYNVLFNPPDYLVASLNAGVDVPTMPIYVDPAGPFGGVAGVTKTIPPGSLRHIDQNIETAYAHFWGLSYQHEVAANLVAKVEYTGSLGPQAVRPRRPEQAWRAARVPGSWRRARASRPRSTRRSTRAATAASRSTTACSSRSRAVAWATRACSSTGSYTYGRAYDNLSTTFSDSGNNFNLGTSTRSTRCSTGASRSSTCGTACRSAGSGKLPFFKEGSGVKRALLGDWQMAFLFNARTRLPFTVFDCTNGFALCMRVEDPVGIDKNATGGHEHRQPERVQALRPHAASSRTPAGTCTRCRARATSVRTRRT